MFYRQSFFLIRTLVSKINYLEIEKNSTNNDFFVIFFNKMIVVLSFTYNFSDSVMEKGQKGKKGKGGHGQRYRRTIEFSTSNNNQQKRQS